ncbi:MAG: hypothetical protein JXA99_09000 [Candidatus Lokiarchaeota archaeon]|nr:hypothetical protein [Candidatus Lokiarchaeota archaeon]
MKKNNQSKKESLIKTSKLNKISESIREKYLSHTTLYPTINTQGYEPSKKDIYNAINRELTPKEIQLLYSNVNAQNSDTLITKIAEALENDAKTLLEQIKKTINEM